MQAAFGICHVPSTHADVAVHGVEFAAAHADFTGDFAGGRRHDLHQALCADAGLRAHDKAALLANQTVNPCRVNAYLCGIADGQVFKRRDIAQFVVELVVGTVCAVDRHVVELVVKSDLCGSQQVVFVEVAGGKTPFCLCLTAHFGVAVALAVFKQNQCAFDGAVFAHAADVSGIGIGNVVARIDAAAQFFTCHYGVEIAAGSGSFFIHFFGLAAFALCGKAAAQPILPCRVFLQFFRHMLNHACQFVPTLQAQSGACVPFQLFVGQLFAVGNAAVVA